MKAKLCGMRSLEAAQAAVDAGADYVGFIFYPPSRRNISPGKAAAICSAIGYKARKVGVFVNVEPYRVNTIAELCNLDLVQLHGDEDANYISQIKKPVIKAIRYHAGLSYREIDKLPAELILIDAGTPEQVGGTGQPFNWREAAEVIGHIKHSVMIAGGINQENLLTAWRTFRPYGVDTASGIETDGEQDVAKIKAFMSEVKRVNEWRTLPKFPEEMVI